MTKLVELIIGSGAEGYRNTNMEVLSVGANHLLRKLDIRNCPNLKQAIDLALCSNIREIWAEGTGTSAVVLPEGGNLTMLHLPDTITNLTVRNQTELTDAGGYSQGYRIFRQSDGRIRTRLMSCLSLTDAWRLMNRN